MTVLGFVLVAACAPPLTRAVPEFKTRPGSDAPDYSRLENWAAHPDKRDASDSIPAPLLAAVDVLAREGTRTDSGVDVFFLHPTTLTSARNEEWNGDLRDSALNAKTDHSTILYQASVFNECRVFAPRYRQAHLRAYYSQDTASSRQAFDEAYGDLRAAFQYYLDHYNQGRPIIIASHSQGTTHAKRLLKEFFDENPGNKSRNGSQGQSQNTLLRGRLVAAYIIGMRVGDDYFSELPPCKDSTATGCVISWRTYRRGTEPEWLNNEKTPSVVVNPLTWTTTEEYAPRSLNMGGILTHFNKLAPGDADAQIHRGILWARPHFPGSFLIRTNNFHIGDINLYYMNIRENVRTRIAAWRRAHA